jgi:hypothetical protein
VRTDAPAEVERPADLGGPVKALLDAVDSVAGDLDLDGVLTRLVTAATRLTDARHGALGVLGHGTDPMRYVTVGADTEAWDRIAAGRRGRHLLVVPVRVTGEVFGVLYLTGKPAGRPFTAEDELLVQALTRTAGHVVAHARAFAFSERRRRWLEAAADLCEALHATVPPDRALEQLARRARAASGARAAAVVRMPRTGPPRVAAYDGPTGLVPAELLRDAAVEAWGAEPADADPHLVVARLRARLADPCAVVLVLPEDQDPDEERELLAAYADQAGLALDRALGVRDREELAVVSERERIARELHDVVIQRLFAAGLQLQTLHDVPPDLVSEGVDAAVDALDAVIRQIRGTVLDLRV